MLYYEESDDGAVIALYCFMCLVHLYRVFAFYVFSTMTRLLIGWTIVHLLLMNDRSVETYLAHALFCSPPRVWSPPLHTEPPYCTAPGFQRSGPRSGPTGRLLVPEDGRACPGSDQEFALGGWDRKGSHRGGGEST